MRAPCRAFGFTEGQTVKAGDFIAQIDPRPYEAALAQAQGQLAKDQALLGQAQGDLARFQQLAKQDSIAMQQVADQIALVAQDKAAIAADQAMVKTAELNVGYAHIVSPVTGRVGLRLVDPGNYLQPSDASGIVVITQIDPISVVLTTTPEDNLPRISARLAIRRQASGYGARPRQCPRVGYRNADHLRQPDRRDHRHHQDAGHLRQPRRGPVPQPVRQRPPSGRHHDRSDTYAPNAAIQLGASGNFVYLLTDNSTVAKRDVTLGPADSKDTVVTSGLKPGDRVVIDGVDRLRDGASVKVVDNPPGAAQAPGQGHEQAGPAGRRAARASVTAIAMPSPGATEGSPATGAASPTTPPANAATQSAPTPGATQGAPAPSATQSAPTPGAPAHGPAK